MRGTIIGIVLATDMVGHARLTKVPLPSQPHTMPQVLAEATTADTCKDGMLPCASQTALLHFTPAMRCAWRNDITTSGHLRHIEGDAYERIKGKNRAERGFEEVERKKLRCNAGKGRP